MVFLILESLGSTELLFILVMALVFFGPRKLPQLSRSLGKSVAEFRRASDDFKRTWEREVSMEESNLGSADKPAMLSPENSILDQDNVSQTWQSPTVEPVTADYAISRQSFEVEAPKSSDPSEFADEMEAPRKRDWL